MLEGLGKVLASVNEEDGEPTNRTVVSETRIAGALTLALTYINRMAGSGADNLGNTLTKGTGSVDAGTMHSRILVVSVAGDVASEYVPVMNCVFAAQKQVRRDCRSGLGWEWGEADKNAISIFRLMFARFLETRSFCSKQQMQPAVST